MARFAILYTLHHGRARQHTIDAWVTDVPEGTKVTELAELLSESQYQAEFSDRGVFLANRRLVTEAQVPKGSEESGSLRTIPWAELTAGRATLVQLNVRVTASERAAVQLAAKAAGQSTADWVREAIQDRLSR